MAQPDDRKAELDSDGARPSPLPFVAVASWQEWTLRLGVALLAAAAIWSVFGDDVLTLAAPTESRPAVRAVAAAAEPTANNQSHK